MFGDAVMIDIKSCLCLTSSRSPVRESRHKVVLSGWKTVAVSRYAREVFRQERDGHVQIDDFAGNQFTGIHRYRGDSGHAADYTDIVRAG
jgi:hypothetical protein